jgi:hypothetical protein
MFFEQAALDLLKASRARHKPDRSSLTATDVFGASGQIGRVIAVAG